MSTLQELAAWLYACTYTAHGRCVLQCEWCSDHEVVVDGDGVHFPADTDALVQLIEHARYGHGSPRSVIVKLYRDALHTSQLDELLASETLTATRRSDAGLAPRDSFDYGR